MPRVSCPNVCIVTVTAMPQFPSMPGFLQTSKAVFNQVTRNAPISSKSWCALEDEVTPGMDMKGNPASDGETEGGRSAGPEVLASAPRSMVLGQGPGHVTGSLTPTSRRAELDPEQPCSLLPTPRPGLPGLKCRLP